MPAKKITELENLATPALADLLPIVDDPAGTPATKKVTLASLLSLFRESIHDVGDLVLTLVDVNPSARFGGTWVKVSQGRALVGVDPADADFDAAEKESGAKTVTLTANEMPAHTHGVTDPGHAHVENSNNTTTGPLRGWGAPDTSTNNQTATGYSTALATTGISVDNAGGGQPHSNVQPSFAVFVWRRTA